VQLHQRHHSLGQILCRVFAILTHLGDHLVVVRDVALVEVDDEVDGVAVERPNQRHHKQTLGVTKPLGREAHGQLAEREGRVDLLCVALDVGGISQAEGEVFGEVVNGSGAGGLVHGAILPVRGAVVKSGADFFCFTAEVHHTDDGILMEANPIALFEVERRDVVRVLTAHKLRVLVLRDHGQVASDLTVVGRGSVHLLKGDADDLSVGESSTNDGSDFLGRSHFLFLSWWSGGGRGNEPSAPLAPPFRR